MGTSNTPKTHFHLIKTLFIATLNIHCKMNQFYMEAAEVLGKLKKSTIKSLVLNSEIANKRKTFAIVAETAKCTISLERTNL
jgi:hypothetical protein